MKKVDYLQHLPWDSEEEFKQDLERLLIETVFRRHASHMVDDVGHRQAIEQFFVGDEIDGVKVQHHVPFERLDAIDDQMELIHVGNAAQMLDEIEAAATNALLVQFLDRLLVKTFVDVGDPTIGAAALGNGIDNRIVVDAMATGIHEHGTRQTKDGLQLLELVEASVRRGIGTIRRERVLGSRSEDVAMRIGGVLR